MHSLNNNGIYWAYLRKSRADKDAELRGEGETLARHEKLIKDTAKRLDIEISKFYREIVSGDTIAERPVMQELLSDINTGRCDGVLVVEVERLARGDSIDQGIISRYFKTTETRIITPAKIYDPNNEFDEEYFEFGLFMSRREFKTINRRLQRGRQASLHEGKWIAGTAPYGYERMKLEQEKGYTLQIVPDKADVVQLVFHLYVHGELQGNGSYRRLGQSLIAKRLDEMGIKPQSSTSWSRSTISDMLKNTAYIGKVAWSKRPYKKTADSSSLHSSVAGQRQKNPNPVIFDGLHPAIVDEDLFYMAQEILSSKRLTHTPETKMLKNPLSGVIKCGRCGKFLTRALSNTRVNYPVLKCPNPYCTNVSSPLELVEKKLVEGLKCWVSGYQLEIDKKFSFFDSGNIQQRSIASLQKEIKTLELQQGKIYDLFEQGVYSGETFRERLDVVTAQLEMMEKNLGHLKNEMIFSQKKLHQSKNFMLDVETILDFYNMSDNPQVKNDFLHIILDCVEYKKDVSNKKNQGSMANFELVIHPKIPKKVI